MEDGWWHLATARWIVTHHQVPPQDIFAFTEPSAPWTYLQSGGSVVLYLVHQLAGDTGLILLRAGIFTIVIALFIQQIRRHIPWPVVLLLALGLTYGLAPRALIRPLIFNFIWIQVLFYLLERISARFSIKDWGLFFILGIIWTNTHLGSLIYGLGTLTLFCLARALECVWPSLRADRNRQVAQNEFKNYLLAALGFLSSFLINPYGLYGALYSFRAILDPNFIHFYQFNTLVQEMGAPWALLLSAQGAPLLFLFLTTLFFLITNFRGRCDWGLLFLYASSMFVYGVQGIGFFTLVSVYTLGHCWPRGERWHAAPSRQLSVMLGVALLIKILTLAPDKIPLFTSPNQNDQHPYPAAAINFLLKNNLTGRVFNEEEFGGYLIWTAYPWLKPFVDGRQLNPERLLTEYPQTLTAPARFWPELQQRYQFDIVLLDPHSTRTQRLKNYLTTEAGWQIAFQDKASIALIPTLHRHAF